MSEDYIELTCYDEKDKEFKTPYTLNPLFKDLKDNLIKNENGCFIKYFCYQYSNNKLHSKKEEIARLEEKEYKRLKKLL